MSDSAFAFFCPVCNKKYIVSADLRQHINLEHCIYMEPRIYVFSCKPHHRKRLKNALDPEFSHACPMCHKRFASEAYLEVHVEGAHFGENCVDFRFACAKPGCEKVYVMEEWKEICLVDREVEMNEDIDLAEWSVRLKSFYPAYKQRRDSLEGTAC